MWILESEGEFLRGKRLWLRPGKRYLFGRVKKDGGMSTLPDLERLLTASVAHAIDHKTISRKHFVIEVSPVKPGSGAQVHTRSKVTITDEKTKGATFIDGEHVLQDNSMDLKGIEHTIKPGKYPHDLKIKWHQVCLSFSFSSKEMKGDPLTPRRERLEELDIKTIIEYVVGETTHVVTTKRNTAKGLQALVNGKHIVENSYIDALVYAATSEDLAEPENVCPLEKDFDAAWPDPTKHLPPAGKEIIDMPAAASEACFEPNMERQNIFEGLTFVFCSKDQYENLMPMVTNGHGKALLYHMENGKTTADELEQYMRNAAGRKGFGDVDTQQQKGGIILVRWIAKGNLQTWADALADEVSLRIDRRPLDQGDFLNIILNNAPGLLRRSLGVASTAGSMVGPPESSTRSIKPPQSSPPRPDPAREASPTQPTGSRRPNPAGELEQPTPKRQRIRGPIRSRFKTFDDGFDVDIDSVPPYPDSPSQMSEAQSEAPLGATHRQASSQQDSVAPSQVDEDRMSDQDEQRMDELLPAAAAMRKQRLEMQQKGKGSKKVIQAEIAKAVRKPRKVDQEIDVIEAARERREAEEEAIRKDQEALEHAGIDVENIKDLAIVVEMDLPVRTDKPTRASGQASDRWDERWNGRKNFKRFRRRGEDGNGRLRHVQNVILPLEEAKKASYGIGPDYWSGGSKSSRGNTQRSGPSQSQLRTVNVPNQAPAETPSPATTRLQQEAEEIVGAIDVDEPRHTRADDHSALRSQTNASKRSAVEQVGIASKRQKTLQTRADDDSEDELKFRFGRRKK